MSQPTLEEIEDGSKLVTWEQARTEGIKNRAEFLKLFPAMSDWLEQGEKHNGAFMGIASITFADDRCVFVYKWEKVYSLEFSNPANEKESQEKSVSLSYEAMNALMTLYRIFESEEDRRRFWQAMGYSPEEVEKHVSAEPLPD